MDNAILVINSGSSSIKFALFRATLSTVIINQQDLLCSGYLSDIGHAVHFFVANHEHKILVDKILADSIDHAGALDILLRWLTQNLDAYHLIGAGHRVVHGGTSYTDPILVDKKVIASLGRLTPLAPLHQPHNLAAITAFTAIYPGLPQVACFDTAFHHTQPKVATIFALPKYLRDQGIQRYGFHGLSYEYIISVLPQIAGSHIANSKVVVAHLGSGASMCALNHQKSVATTMGFTALDGLPMSRRCGNLDPGVVLYLMQEKNMTAQAITHLLYEESGLLGVSGISDDIRTLLANESAEAGQAIDLFTYQINRELGSLVAILGGLDALVFTAGIGEHASTIRQGVCAAAARWLDLQIDHDANIANQLKISTANSPISVWVIPTDEDLMIARHTMKVLQEHLIRTH